MSSCSERRKPESSSAISTRMREFPDGRGVMGDNVSLVPVGVQEPEQPVAVIGAGLDLGAGRRGVDMGPSAIRYAGLDERIKGLGYEVDDRGNVGTAVAEAIDAGDEQARFLPQIKETCRHIADLVAESAGNGSIPLVLGGDHSVALGTLGGLHRAY